MMAKSSDFILPSNENKSKIKKGKINNKEIYIFIKINKKKIMYEQAIKII